MSSTVCLRVRVENPAERTIMYRLQRARKVQKYIEAKGGTATLAELLEQFDAETLCLFFQIRKLTGAKIVVTIEGDILLGG